MYVKMMRNTTVDIAKQLIEKYKNGNFRILYNGTVKTVEIQNANFVCDKDWVIRRPNYEYAEREIEWYNSQSLYVKDIPGKTPTLWESSADGEGKINSNYGWVIYSEENYSQYQHCLDALIKDPQTRQAVMLYNRPSMQVEYNENGRHDFMCTYSIQCFLNQVKEGYELKYIVYMRSNDAVFGFDNDVIWHTHVANKLAKDISEKLNVSVIVAPIEWNAGSFHVYERHFKFLDALIEEMTPDCTKCSDFEYCAGEHDKCTGFISNN